MQSHVHILHNLLILLAYFVVYNKTYSLVRFFNNKTRSVPVSTVPDGIFDFVVRWFHLIVVEAALFNKQIEHRLIMSVLNKMSRIGRNAWRIIDQVVVLNPLVPGINQIHNL